MSQFIKSAIKCSKNFPATRQYSTSAPTVKLFINGQALDSKATEHTEVRDPATNELLSLTPNCTRSEMESAVSAAKEAQAAWRSSNVLTRQTLFLRYQALIREHASEIAANLVKENGKTTQDAEGDVLRGLQMVDMCAAIPTLLLGDSMNNIAVDMDTISYKVPLGVTGAICPFNFPAMVPLWSFPISVACGNAVVLKPSERVPGASLMLAELFQKAGAPPGLLNIIHGTSEAVNFVCEHPDIRAVSFVGSDRAGKHVYERASAHGKRVQCNNGAKNHCVVMPDANKNKTVAQIVGAAFGAAGQRCMAISVAVFVGKSREWIPDLVTAAKALKVNAGHVPGTDIGPVISPQSKSRIQVNSIAENSFFIELINELFEPIEIKSLFLIIT